MNKLVWLGALLALPALAQDFNRSEIPQNGFSYVLGNAQERWQGGRIDWYYNPANQPAGLSTADVVGLIQIAAAKWAGMCNLQFNYLGLHSAAPNMGSDPNAIDRVNVIGWAALSGDKAGFDGYTKWWYSSGNMIDADIALNTAKTWTQNNKSDLEALITHEIGHALGLNHSNVQFAVMAGTSQKYPAIKYNSYSFQRTLRGDDAQGCAALYGASPYAESNRLFNWVEVGSPYAAAFTPAVRPSASYEGYYYRAYPSSNSALGTKDGDVWYLDPYGKLQNVGPVSNYLGSAYEDGF